MPSCGVHPSVHLSVRPSRSCILSKINKHIFNIFSPSGSYTILVFRTKRNSNIPPLQVG